MCVALSTDGETGSLDEIVDAAENQQRNSPIRRALISSESRAASLRGQVSTLPGVSCGICFGYRGESEEIASKRGEGRVECGRERVQSTG